MLHETEGRQMTNPVLKYPDPPKNASEALLRDLAHILAKTVRSGQLSLNLTKTKRYNSRLSIEKSLVT